MNPIITMGNSEITLKPYKRDLSFDFVKGVLIFLVVYGHVIQFLNPDTYNENVIFAIIYSFHMPLFVFISGFFATRTLQKSIKDCMKKVWWRLLVPALVWSAISFVMLYLRGYERGMASMMVDSLRSVWFLYCIASLYVVGCVVFKIGKRKYTVAVIIAIAAYLCYNLPGVVYVEYFQPIRQWPLFVMGFAFYEYRHNLQRHFILVIVIVSAVIYIGLMAWLASNHPLEYIRSHENYLLRAVIYQTGAIMWFSCLKGLFEAIHQTRLAGLIAKLGCNTMGIYVMNAHVLLLLTWLLPLGILAALPFWLTSLLLTSVLLGVTLLFKKNKYSAMFLLGE